MKITYHMLAAVMFTFALSITANAATANTKPVSAPAGVMEALKTNTPQDVIVEFDSTAVQADADTQRKTLHLEHESREIVEYKAKRYSDIKRSSFTKLAKTEHDVVHDYDHLPMAHLRIKTANALNALLRDPAIKAIYKDEIKYATLDAASLNLVNQPPMATAGFTGAGTVVVIDSGVDYTKADFGSCTSPGVPAGCKVNYYQNLVGTGTLDNLGHGTNVSGIIAALAPTASIASLNVFGANATTSDSLVIAALNNIIANYYSYANSRVVAVNMSLGDNIQHHGSCPGSPYDTPILQLAQYLDIYVAAGNNAFGNGINLPACVPYVTPVGAVYSGNIGAMNYGLCADATTAANQVACFSNFDASFPNMALAPGVNQTAGGYTMTGTSMATPYVSATAAILAPFGLGRRSGFSYVTYPAWGPSVNVTRGIYSGTFQALDMKTPMVSQNDNFASPGVVNVDMIWGSSNRSINGMATKEAGEPNHAGNAGGKSVWVTFTSLYSTTVRVDTHDSSFDTLLAVYTGTSVSALTQIAANDNDGINSIYTASSGLTSGLTFPAQAGVTYNIAVDGKNGASGLYVLNVNYLPSSNSTFLTRIPITGLSGSVSGVGAGNSGGLWWSWIAPANGQLTLNTGSYLYTGTDPLSLTLQTGVNNKYLVQSGVQYQIFVGMLGNVVLNWSLNTSPTADLSLSLTGTGTGNTSTGLYYSANITNAGPDIAVNSRLTLTLPAKVTFSGGTAGCTATGAIVTCLLGNMAPGTAKAISISGNVSVAGTYVANASVTSDVTDPVVSNNSASWTSNVVVGTSDLSISSFTGSGDTMGNLTYSAVAANVGPDTAANGKLIVTLPAHATFTSGSTGCTANGVTVTCLIGTMFKWYTYPINVVANVGSPGTYVANASVSSDMIDPNTANNSASASATITVIDNDVPTLPEWGVIIMGLALMTLMVIAEKKRRGRS